VFIFYGQKQKVKHLLSDVEKCTQRIASRFSGLGSSSSCAFPGFTQWQNAGMLTLTAAGPHGLLTHFPFLGVFFTDTCNLQYSIFNEIIIPSRLKPVYKNQ